MIIIMQLQSISSLQHTHVKLLVDVWTPSVNAVSQLSPFLIVSQVAQASESCFLAAGASEPGWLSA